MIGSAPSIQRVYQMAQLVARRDTTVLITGQSGTGKDLVAQAIHTLSRRQNNPFVVINCAAIPEPLLEAELFGYTKGAFTGAVQSRIGRIHAAQGGTLFLDEIGDLPLGLQSKLLRFLEQGEVQRLGSSDTFRVDVRVVAATNCHLQQLVKEQRFREDLYYRLAVFPIELPLLKDRLEDLPRLTASFLNKFSPHRHTMSAEANLRLMQHAWQGNVRELRNVIERATILANDESVILPKHIVF
jgi:transcriptional regulator with PAS, ATPase and Fis domain